MAKKNPETFLEMAVWDALKNSRCPAEHRYQGPSVGLPCRWCRSAHVIMLALGKIENGDATAGDMILEFQRQLGWNFSSPVVGEKPSLGIPIDKKG